jgi:hypothetical protein
MADIRPDRLTTCQSEQKSVVSRRPTVYCEQPIGSVSRQEAPQQHIIISSWEFHDFDLLIVSGGGRAALHASPSKHRFTNAFCYNRNLQLPCLTWLGSSRTLIRQLIKTFRCLTTLTYAFVVRLELIYQKIYHPCTSQDTQYRLVQSGKTASGGCSAGQGSSELWRHGFIYFFTSQDSLDASSSISTDHESLQDSPLQNLLQPFRPPPTHFVPTDVSALPSSPL